jgi:hypothetical protein
MTAITYSEYELFQSTVQNIDDFTEDLMIDMAADKLYTGANWREIHHLCKAEEQQKVNHLLAQYL